MALYCPLLKEEVVYLTCSDCDDKQACRKGLLANENTKEGEEKDEHDNHEK